MSQACLNIHTKFGGNPFGSLGEKRGQTNKLFSNFSMRLAGCTQHCWDRKKISCFSPAPSSYLLLDDPDANAGDPIIKFTIKIKITIKFSFFTALAPAHFFPVIKLNWLGSVVVQTVWDRFKHGKFIMIYMRCTSL